MTAGRPTTYDPAYCEEVVSFLADGFSLAAFAGQIGVARSTVYKWAEEHEEFSDAVKRAQAGAVLAWEKRLRDFSLDGNGNATAIIFGLKNRASEEWKDITRQEQTGADGEAIRTENATKLDVSGLTDEQLRALSSIRVSGV